MIRHLRPTPSDERGLTVVELVVTLAVMSLIATVALAVSMRAFADTGTIQNRRDVLADGRFAIDQLTKQLRQAEGVDLATSSATQISFTTYIEGTVTDEVWRVTGSQAPYTLEQSRDGSGFWTMLTNLRSNQVFQYVQHEYGDQLLLDQVTVTLPLGTKTSTIQLVAHVRLRNVGE